MIDRFRENLSAHWRETIGFALFLAWVHCALFGCGLSSAKEPIACVPTTYHLEHIWLTCGLFEALGGIAGMLIARDVYKRQAPGRRYRAPSASSSSP